METNTVLQRFRVERDRFAARAVVIAMGHGAVERANLKRLTQAEVVHICKPIRENRCTTVDKRSLRYPAARMPSNAARARARLRCRRVANSLLFPTDALLGC